MSLSEPSVDQLLAWWCGEIENEAAREVEEKIFSDRTWADAAERLAELDELVRETTLTGLTAVSSVTVSTLRRLEADGVSLRHYAVDPEGTCPCQASDDQFFLVHLNAELGGVDRVDVQLETSDGLTANMEDVAFDRDRNQVVLVWPGERVRAQPDGTLTFTLYSGAGDKRPLGVYTLEHSSQMAD